MEIPGIHQKILYKIRTIAVTHFYEGGGNRCVKPLKFWRNLEAVERLLCPLV